MRAAAAAAKHTHCRRRTPPGTPSRTTDAFGAHVLHGDDVADVPAGPSPTGRHAHVACPFRPRTPAASPVSSPATRPSRPTWADRRAASPNDGAYSNTSLEGPLAGNLRAAGSKERRTTVVPLSTGVSVSSLRSARGSRPFVLLEQHEVAAAVEHVQGCLRHGRTWTSGTCTYSAPTCWPAISTGRCASRTRAAVVQFS